MKDISNDIAKTVKPKRASKMAKAVGAKETYQPAHADPKAELRRLVHEHKALTRASVTFAHTVRDKVNRATGEKIKSRVPADAQAVAFECSKHFKDAASKLETDMVRELRKLPLYNLYLKHVFGCGPVVAAYLIAYVDASKCEKPSNLRRYLGLAVIDGRLERPVKGGGTLKYVAELRTRLFQMFTSMAKNAYKKTASAPHGVTSKYLQVWRDGWCTRVAAGSKGAFKAAMWRAASVFAEDLYVIARAIDGLPVWPTFYAAKLGFVHGGATLESQAPKMMTSEEAIAHIGNVGSVPLERAFVKPGAEDIIADDETEECIAAE